MASFDVHAQKTFTPLCPHELPVSRGRSDCRGIESQAEKAQFRIGSKEAHNSPSRMGADQRASGIKSYYR